MLFSEGPLLAMHFMQDDWMMSIRPYGDSRQAYTPDLALEVPHLRNPARIRKTNGMIDRARQRTRKHLAGIRRDPLHPLKIDFESF